MNLDHLKFPIGPFEKPASYTDATRSKAIDTIVSFPDTLMKLLNLYPAELLNQTYRPEGWTVRQVVHHCADSHMNAFIRCKLTLTEDKPTVKPYEEAAWAELEDANQAPIEPSIALLIGLHSRWAMVFRNMKPEDFEREFYHPESQRHVSLNENLAFYAWHCTHHIAHVKLAADILV